MNSGDQAHCLADLAERIRGGGYSQNALRASLHELSYILRRIQELTPDSNVALRFYSQCLLLWGCRILEILVEELKVVAKAEIPPDLRLARHILAAHYGWAHGKLKSKLTTELGYVESPSVLPDGNFRYLIGSLGSPGSTASTSERELVSGFFKEYCPNDKDFNWWFACYKILHQSDRVVDPDDVRQIEEFIRNNGGVITESQSVIECVVKSVEKYLTTDG